MTAAVGTTISAAPPSRRSTPRPTLLPLLLIIAAASSSIGAASAFSTMSSSSSAAKASQQQQHNYPRPLHPGGLTLPPLVEDRLRIAVADKNDGMLQTSVLVTKPPDVESLWEWYAYTLRKTDSDPSWGRVWPTALSLSRFVVRTMLSPPLEEGGAGDRKLSLLERAELALRSSRHAVEVGCGLGVVGLTYAACVSESAASASSNDSDGGGGRTVTFLDREPYALQCAMASAATNGVATVPIARAGRGRPSEDGGGAPPPVIVARAAVDDWTLPIEGGDEDGGGEEGGPSSGAAPPPSGAKNVRHRDLHLEGEDGRDGGSSSTIILASDVLYEPSNMASLATKLRSLLHPRHGGYVLLADPVKERTRGCRDAFLKAVEELGGEAETFSSEEFGPGGGGAPLAPAGSGRYLLEGDVDIDGNLAETVLIVVRFGGEGR